jgi:D-alanyl-D-alanine carboxypeptidase
MRWLSALISTMMVCSCAQPASYRAVECDAAKPYAGPALLPSPTANDLAVAGPLEGVFDAAIVARLEAATAAAMTASKAQAITVSVARPGQGVWSAVRTIDAAQPAPERFWWASAGKMATAVVVLQLVEEGRLSLADPISKHVTGVPNGDAVTIEHLLDHTSGLFSADEDQQVRARRPGGPLSLDEQLAIARRHGARFCPGQRWRYSNTGYALLGAVIERLERRPYAEVVQARVLSRLGPTSLRVLVAGDPAAEVASAAPANLREPRVEPSWAGPAGNLIGRAEGMSRLLQAVLGSELLSSETTQRQLARLYPMFDNNTFYGLGVMVYAPAGSDLRLVGHSGGAPGLKATTLWSPVHRAFVSVALTSDGSAEAAANLLFRGLGWP